MFVTTGHAYINISPNTNQARLKHSRRVSCCFIYCCLFIQILASYSCDVDVKGEPSNQDLKQILLKRISKSADYDAQAEKIMSLVLAEFSGNDRSIFLGKLFQKSHRLEFLPCHKDWETEPLPELKQPWKAWKCIETIVGVYNRFVPSQEPSLSTEYLQHQVRYLNCSLDAYLF